MRIACSRRNCPATLNMPGASAGGGFRGSGDYEQGAARPERTHPKPSFPQHILCNNNSWARSNGRFRDRQRHPIKCRRHMRRQLATQRLVVEIGVEIGEDRASRLDALNPAQRVVDGKVTWMWGVAKRVEDPNVECIQRVQA